MRFKKKFKVTVSALTSRKAETLWKTAHTRQRLEVWWWPRVLTGFILLKCTRNFCLCPWHQIALHVKFKVFRQDWHLMSPAPKHTESALWSPRGICRFTLKQFSMIGRIPPIINWERAQGPTKITEWLNMHKTLYAQRCGEKGNFLHGWGRTWVQPPWRRTDGGSLKAKNRAAMWTSILFLGIYL